MELHFILLFYFRFNFYKLFFLKKLFANKTIASITGTVKNINARATHTFMTMVYVCYLDLWEYDDFVEIVNVAKWIL